MTFPALHSVLDPAALAEWLRAEYALTDVTVTFLRRGLNDTYEVTSAAGFAVLRVYRCGWRTPADVAWELALIERAAARGVGMARPIARRDGTTTGVLRASEGDRFYVLFEFAPGRMPGPVPDDAGLYGQTAAALHVATEGLDAGGRFPLDLAHLIHAPLARMRPLLAGDPDTLAALEGVAERTAAALEGLLPHLAWGACHGDLHEGNAHVGDDGVLRLFDVDCGGPGWRAYDLAVYLWSQASNSGKSAEQEDAAWTAFLTAYRAVRPLTEAEVAAIPLFVTARSLWFMGLYAERTCLAGTQSLDPGFFRYGLDFIRRWESREAATLPTTSPATSPLPSA